MLQIYLNRQAYALLDMREGDIAGLQTIDDWRLRQQMVRRILTDLVGPFPEKTALNTKITGVIKREGFRVENILFESVPGFYVTGCMFIPEGGPARKPAILNVIGHSTRAFQRDVYQNFILNLVKKNFIVFAIDPIGQGERLQYFDEEAGESVVWAANKNFGSTHEHSFLANQYLLAGGSLIKYYIWDGIRAIDYLLTREEVDKNRIGLTGISGGGNQTAFIGALDERINATAPSCYITSYRRLLEYIGPQDGEQNLFHGISSGLDYADLLELRAPKPTLIVSTTHDFFSIQGARETFEEVKKAYRSFGKEGNITMSEADNKLVFIRKNNEATYAFFQKELENPGSPIEEKIEIFPENELKVTPTGQVSTSYRGKSVFDLIRTEAEMRERNLEDKRKMNPSHAKNVRQKARELSGYITPASECKSIFRGRYQRDGYSIELYAIEGDQSHIILLLLAIPGDGELGPAVIFIHPEGKELGINPGGNIENLVQQGFIVATPDRFGIGETRSLRTGTGSHGYEAQLIGRSIVGIQAGDIVRVSNFLKGSPRVDSTIIQAIAFGEQCPALLHAAAFDSSITGTVLVEAPVSFFNNTQTRMYKYSFSFDWGVAGALMHYDLPDLVSCIVPRKLVFIGLQNGAKEAASKELLKSEMSYPESVYARNHSNNFKIIPLPADNLIRTISDLLKE